jgi:hypothetical protein
MMETKFFMLRRPVLLCIFSLVLFCCLAASDASAQISTVNPEERDQAIKPPSLKRIEFLDLSDSAQMSFLSNPPFVIIDLVNATAADILNPTPDEIFVTDVKFYDQHSTPPSLERDMLHFPGVFKIYDPH